MHCLCECHNDETPGDVNDPIAIIGSGTEGIMGYICRNCKKEVAPATLPLFSGPSTAALP
jgi:hypothetical protein